MSPPNLPPKGDASGDAPQLLLVEGILDGRVLQAEPLQQAVAALGQCGAGQFRLDITGGRFNIIPENPHVPAGRFDAAAQSNFLDRLQAVADAAQPGSIETNLRCKLVYETEVAETLFVVRGPQIEPVTRRRPRTEQDGTPLTSTEDATALGMRRRELMWLAPVMLVVGLLIAWQSGWMDRMFAARSEQVITQTGPFDDMLEVTIERSWGSYDITLVRGPGYPATTAALQARLDGSTTIPARAACELVGNGGALFVQLAQEDGKVLSELRTDLRTLLTDEKGEVLVKLPGSAAAHHVLLSLSSGKPQK